MNIKVLKKCKLFEGLDDRSFRRSLELVDAYEKSYEKGSFLNTVASPMRYFGLVTDGRVQVLRDDREGHHMIMANVGRGDTFGESLCYLGRLSPVYIKAVKNSTVVWMNGSILAHPEDYGDGNIAILAHRYTKMLAERALDMNDRIQILSQLTIRSKINTFLMQQASKAGSDSFRVPFDRQDMAFYLGADRSALSRELGKMKKEGLIDFEDNRFLLLSKDFRAAADQLD